MSKNEEFKYRIVSDFISGKLKRIEAAELLSISQRSVARIARRIQKKGFLGVKHGNFQSKPVNKICSAQKKETMDLVKEKYFDLNMTHCFEKLRNDHHCNSFSYDTFRRWCHDHKMVKRTKRRSSTVRKQRVRMPCEGLMLQMDGSHHKWNRKNEWCLIAAIDDASSDIPYGEFFLSEDTLNCMTILQRIIELKGIPETLYTDRAGWFGGQKRSQFSQFTRACEELGIRVIFASTPQAKGRIERAWDTFQDRLIPEMRLRQIQTVPKANEYLHNEFIPNYWRRKNTVPPKSPESRYRAVPKGVDLNEIFCLKHYRTVKNDHTFSWNGDTYIIDSDLKYSIHKQKIEIKEYQNMTWSVFFAGKKIDVSVIPSKYLKRAA